MSPIAADPCDYFSTACQHGLHSACRRTCKWCETACQCECHVEGTFRNLLADSSLGTPGAERLRARTSKEITADVVRRLGEGDDDG